MKKSILLQLLPLTVMTMLSCHSHNDQLLPGETNMSLNGFTQAQADNLVGNFVDDNSSSDTATAVWFGRSWIEKIVPKLDTEKNTKGADGIRIYFAKTTAGKNAIIIVSTRQAAPDTNSITKFDHTDYFNHKGITTNDTGVPNYGDDGGALLFKGKVDCSKDGCSNDGYYIPCADAHLAVTNFHKQKTINIDAEWFPLAELDSVRSDLDRNHGDGLRIYFGRRAKKDGNRIRACFLLETTRDSSGLHRDYFNCKPAGLKGGKDNGEQCPNNCNGVTLPAN